MLFVSWIEQYRHQAQPPRDLACDATVDAFAVWFADFAWLYGVPKRTSVQSQANQAWAICRCIVRF